MPSVRSRQPAVQLLSSWKRILRTNRHPSSLAHHSSQLSIERVVRYFKLEQICEGDIRKESSHHAPPALRNVEGIRRRTPTSEDSDVDADALHLMRHRQYAQRGTRRYCKCLREATSPSSTSAPANEPCVKRNGIAKRNGNVSSTCTAMTQYFVHRANETEGSRAILHRPPSFSRPPLASFSPLPPSVSQRMRKVKKTNDDVQSGEFNLPQRRRTTTTATTSADVDPRQ